MDWIALFKDFGFPAAMAGALLYILIFRLDGTKKVLEELAKEIALLTAQIVELRSDLNDTKKQLEDYIFKK